MTTLSKAIKTAAPPPPYTIQNTTGGHYHVYPGGKKVFVASKQVTAKPGTANLPPRPPAPPPATQSAGSQQAAAAAPAQFAPDSQYSSEVANAVSKNAGVHTGLTEAGVLDKSNYEEALRRMGIDEGNSRTSQSESLNRQNLLFSGHGAQQLQDLSTTYARQRADALQGFTGRENDRAQQGRAADAEQGSTETTSYGNAADRQTTREGALAANNTLAPNTPYVAPVPAIHAVAKAVVAAKRPVVTKVTKQKTTGKSVTLKRK